MENSQPLRRNDRGSYGYSCTRTATGGSAGRARRRRVKLAEELARKRPNEYFHASIARPARRMREPAIEPPVPAEPSRKRRQRQTQAPVVVKSPILSLGDATLRAVSAGNGVSAEQVRKYLEQGGHAGARQSPRPSASPSSPAAWKAGSLVGAEPTRRFDLQIQEASSGRARRGAHLEAAVATHMDVSVHQIGQRNGQKRQPASR